MSTDLGLMEAKDIAQLKPVGLNLLRLFQQCCGDFDAALVKIDNVTQQEHGETLLEVVCRELLTIVTDGDAKEMARIRAAEVIAKIYGNARSDAAKVRSEVARVAADAQREHNKLYIEERRLETMGKVAAVAEMTDEELEAYASSI